MEFKIQLPFKKNDVIYTIECCKIEKYYVKDIEFTKIPNNLFKDVGYDISIKVDRYNDGVNSSRKEILLKHCFLSKQDLIKQLE